MATKDNLQRLNNRATEAENQISSLKSQLESVKQAAIKAEEERLRQENKELREEVESLKQRLTLAEIKNGSKMEKQVQMPVNSKRSKMIYTRQKDRSERPPYPSEIKPVKQNNTPNKMKCAIDAKVNADATNHVEGNRGKQKAAAKPGRAIDFSRLDIRIGKIVKVEKLDDSRNLYEKKVDFGEETTKTVLSGLIGSVTLEEMQHKMAVFLCNLKPKRMRGVVSVGVMLCAFGSEKVEMLVPPAEAEVGDRVICKDFPGTADSRLRPRKKIWETITRDLSTNEENIACYKGKPLEVDGKGPVTVPTLSNTGIK